MKKWLVEYQRLNNKTWLLGVFGFLVIFGLVVRELFALYVDVTLYELPVLPDDVWWEVFVSVSLALIILSVVKVRFWIICRNGYSGVTSALTITATFLFLFYAYVTQPASNDIVCDSAGRCFGIYSLTRQDWVGLAAILYLPGTLIRSFLTLLAAIVSVRSKFE